MVSLALSILSAFVADEEETTALYPQSFTMQTANSPQVAPGKYQHGASTLADTPLKCDSK